MEWYEDPVYIKMCEKAEEIQKLCNYDEGDVVHDGDGIEIIGSILTVGDHQATRGGYDYDFFDYEWSRVIWLPRQEDLQGMVGDALRGKLDGDDIPLIDYTPLSLLGVFAKELTFDGLHLDGWKYCYDQFTSMNQLWLAFIMFQKFGKKWTGEEWNEISVSTVD